MTMGKLQGEGDDNAAWIFNDNEMAFAKSGRVGEAARDAARGQRFGTLEVTRAELIDAGRRLLLDLHGGELNRHEVEMLMRELQYLQEKKQIVDSVAPPVPAARNEPDPEVPAPESYSSGC
jgi:hypothetical protein